MPVNVFGIVMSLGLAYVGAMMLDLMFAPWALVVQAVVVLSRGLLDLHLAILEMHAEALLEEGELTEHGQARQMMMKVMQWKITDSVNF